jgi:signal transduction histidine kinase
VSLPPQVGHTARVALAAALAVGIVYLGCGTVLYRVVSGRLVAAVDARLHERLSDVDGGHPGTASRLDVDDDADEAPVFLWRAAPGRTAVRLTAGAPALPSDQVPATVRPVTVHLGSSIFRLDQVRWKHGWLVAGQNLAEQEHIEGVLRDGEALAAPVLLLAMFAGALVIGLRALSPVEQSRRRQLEFTADASHELRTPLSVISAETGIALSAPRKASEYRAALTRIQGESQRLRRIVEDLLWLARFDSEPPRPGAEPLDLTTIAQECAQRFQAVARSQSLGITVTAAGSEHAWISAPPEWIDRLAGVLVDNACRYAGPGGTVRIRVALRGNRVSMAVEDSGPGIPADDRARLFGRFHRATEQGGGAGLGLAIADSIVRSTGGHWRIGESRLGGALFEVSWRRPMAWPHGTVSRPALPQPASMAPAPGGGRLNAPAPGNERD